MSTISTSTTLTNSDISGYTWPATINGGTESNPVLVTFDDDISFNSASKYFIIGSEYITIDGNNKNVTINDITCYSGLVQNGTQSTNGYSNVTVQNINVDSDSSTLADSMGWIGHSYFGKSSSDVIVNNCSSSGCISGQGASGICGLGLSRNGTSTISNCYSSGCICGPDAGGICGPDAGSNNGIVTVSNCYSSGAISGNNSGGICGSYAGSYGGTTIVSKCSSSGAISGNNASGICGFMAGYNSGTVDILICSSSGCISGQGASGICGKNAASNNGTATVSNSYSSGCISGQCASGIFGYGAASNNGRATVSNSYSSGCICGKNADGIFGKHVGNTSSSNTYIANGSWNNISASNNLTGNPIYDNSVLVNPIGNIWTELGPYDDSTPWIFTNNVLTYTLDTNNNTAFVSGNTIGNIPIDVVVPSTITDNNIVYSVTSIGDNAFLSCTSLISVTIRNSVTSIGNNAFKSCSSLDSVTIPNSVTSIGNLAFDTCTNLINVVISDQSTITVNTNSFTDVSSNTDSYITFYNTNSENDLSGNWPKISSYYAKQIYPAGDMMIINNIKYTLDDNNNSAVVSGNTIDISTNVVIPSSVSYDSGISYSVTSIGNSAFESCTGLSSVTIPNSVTSIGDSAFNGCSSLRSLTWEDSSIFSSIGETVFDNGALGNNSTVTYNNTVSNNNLPNILKNYTYPTDTTIVYDLNLE